MGAARDVVRTAHFAAWWNADVVTHILQRDQGVPAGRSAGGPSLGTVTTYRGSGRGTEVHGLEPNTRYKFTLRLVSPRSHSRLSPPLEVWTAPAPPSSPIIVRDETKAIVLNWRAGPGGATKYVLESRLVNSREPKCIVSLTSFTFALTHFIRSSIPPSPM